MYRTLEQLVREEANRQRRSSPETAVSASDVKVPLSQGDVLDECPIVFWPDACREIEGQQNAVCVRQRVVVLTQACDLAQKKTKRALVAVVHDAKSLVDTGSVKPRFIRDNVRPGKVYGWYFLPSDPHCGISESLVSFHDLHTIPLAVLTRLMTHGRHVCRIVTPYREHMAQHFSVTFSRIGLPEPYSSEP